MLTALILSGLVVGFAEPAVSADSPKEAIRNATGLRFAVFESYLRRNIIRTRTPYGFKIHAVDPDSPAEKSELQKGDILLEWEGKPIRKLAELAKWIAKGKAQKPVKITVARRKKNISRWARRRWKTIETTITPRYLLDRLDDRETAAFRDTDGVRIRCAAPDRRMEPRGNPSRGCSRWP